MPSTLEFPGTLKIEADLVPPRGVLAVHVDGGAELRRQDLHVRTSGFDQGARRLSSPRRAEPPRVVQSTKIRTHCIKVPRVADDLKKEGPVHES